MEPAWEPETPQNVKWTLTEALALVRDLQPISREYGYHLTLGGGVLNKGYSVKDLDLWWLPLNDASMTRPMALVNFFGTRFLDVRPISSYGELHRHVKFTWGMFRMETHTGNTVEMFIIDQQGKV